MGQPISTPRIRFLGVQRVSLADDRCRVRVRLQLPAATYVGSAEGQSSVDDEIRAAAQATLDALGQVMRAQNPKDPVAFTLREAGPFDAFGNGGVMVALRVETQSKVRSLLGFSPAGDDVLKASSLAVLNATNRFLAVLR